MRRVPLVCLLALVFPAAAHATPGDLDPTFSRDGYTTVGFGDAYASGSAIAVDGQGRIVVAGTTGNDFDQNRAQLPAAIAVARFLPSGDLDAAFSGDGRARLEIGASPRVGDVAVDSSGRIVVGASGGAELVALRLLPDGTPDPAFSGDGIARAPVGGSAKGGSLLLDATGQPTIGGSSCATGSSCRFALARFDASGNPDPAFDGDGIVTTSFPGDYTLLNDLAATGAGGVRAAGDTLRSELAIAQYTPTGALDQTFNGVGMAIISDFTQGARTIAVDPAGRTLGIGGFGNLYRLTPEPAIDPAFTRSYLVRGRFVIDSQDHVVAAGTYGGCYRGCTPVDTVVGRADAATGAIDKGFGGGYYQNVAVADVGVAADDGASAVAVDDADRPVTAGYARDEMAVARFESAAGPPDMDGDGVLNADDKCPLRFSHRRDGCPRTKRKLTLHRRPRADLWVGRIKSRLERCNVSQDVRVFRMQPGRDERTVEATTDGDGRWSADGNLRHGTYYARIDGYFKDRIGTCTKARSNAVTIG